MLPDAIEESLVVGHHPALGNQTLLQAKDRNGAPPVSPAGASAFGRGEDDGTLVVRQNSIDGDPEGRVGQLASPGEVAQHLVAAAIVVGDLAAAGYMPRDVVGQHGGYRCLIAAGVEEVLAIVEVSDELCMWMLPWHQVSLTGLTGLRPS